MIAQLRDVALARGGFRLAVDALGFDAGEFHALLGGNGAGKSTLLAVLSGAARTTAGEVRLHGMPIDDWPRLDRARHLAVLSQRSELDFAFSAAEVVELGALPLRAGWRERRARVRELMRRTDCLHLAARSFPSLSGGEQQRVNLARVLLQLSEAERPPLLLLDEPTSAQDLAQQHRVLTLGRALASERGYAVVAVLHDLNLALRYCARATLLDAGSAVTSGPTDAVLTPARIERYWGYRPEWLRRSDGQAVLA